MGSESRLRMGLSVEARTPPNVQTKCCRYAKVCGDGFGEQGPGLRGSSTITRTIVIVCEGLPFQIALGETVSSKNLERVSCQKLNRQPTQFDVSK